MEIGYTPLLVDVEAMIKLAVFSPVPVIETNEGLLSKPKVTELSSVSAALTAKEEEVPSTTVTIDEALMTGLVFGVVTKSVLEKDEAPYVLIARTL